MRKVVFPYLLIAPALIAVIGVLGYGVVGGLHLSFHNLDAQFTRTFVGLDNYRSVFGDQRFVAALHHTLTFVLGSVSLSVALAMIFALALNSVRRFTQFMRSLGLVPYFVSGIATAIMWRFLFSTNAGLVNWVLQSLGVDEISWLGQTATAMLVVILASSWFIVPLATLMLLGGLQTIDEQLFDAARIDGAGSVAIFMRVTLPLIRPMLGVSLVWISYASFSMFDIILALTGGGPFRSTEVLSLFMYLKGFRQLDFGQGAVIMVVILSFNILLSLIYLRLLVVPSSDSGGRI
jgi:ABC-type sugar transport system permease subunit